MIITRTPFRITLGGGGTDLPGYYSKHGGFVLSAALNKYMFIYLNTPIVDDLVRVKYSKSETVEDVSELQHTLCREALRLFGIRRAIEVISMADVPAGTGLGSSSCYLVGLLNALHTLSRQPVSRRSWPKKPAILSWICCGSRSASRINIWRHSAESRRCTSAAMAPWTWSRWCPARRPGGSGEPYSAFLYWPVAIHRRDSGRADAGSATGRFGSCRVLFADQRDRHGDLYASQARQRAPFR